MGEYDNLDDLPEGVLNSLPKHAQKIYMEAHNSAIEGYDGDGDAEAYAHRIAWSAVKQKYEKASKGNWHKKDSS